MAYTPTTWATGDTVTATKLNKLEQGVANAGSALIITEANNTLDKTFAEIYDAIANGIPCYVKYKDFTPSSLDGEYAYMATTAPVVYVGKYDETYRIYVVANTTFLIGSYSFVGTPALYAYSAADSQSYPTFYAKVCVNNNTTAVSASAGH